MLSWYNVQCVQLYDIVSCYRHLASRKTCEFHIPRTCFPGPYIDTMYTIYRSWWCCNQVIITSFHREAKQKCSNISIWKSIKTYLILLKYYPTHSKIRYKRKGHSKQYVFFCAPVIWASTWNFQSRCYKYIMYIIFAS